MSLDRAPKNDPRAYLLKAPPRRKDISPVRDPRRQAEVVQLFFKQAPCFGVRGAKGNERGRELHLLSRKADKRDANRGVGHDRCGSPIEKARHWPAAATRFHYRALAFGDQLLGRALRIEPLSQRGKPAPRVGHPNGEGEIPTERFDPKRVDKILDRAVAGVVA